MQGLHDIKVLKLYRELRSSEARSAFEQGDYRLAGELLDGYGPIETRQRLQAEAEAKVTAEEAAIRDELIARIRHDRDAETFFEIILEAAPDQLKEAVANYENYRFHSLLRNLSDAGQGLCTYCKKVVPAEGLATVYVEGIRTNGKSDCSYDWWSWTEEFKATHHMCAACQTEATFEKQVRLESRDHRGERAPLVTIRSRVFEMKYDRWEMATWETDSRDWFGWAVHYPEDWLRVYADASQVDDPYTGSRPFERTETDDAYWIHFLDEWRPIPEGTEKHLLVADQIKNHFWHRLDELAEHWGLLPELTAQLLWENGRIVGKFVALTIGAHDQVALDQPELANPK